MIALEGGCLLVEEAFQGSSHGYNRGIFEASKIPGKDCDDNEPHVGHRP
jgi:hypothetical protein